jgi:hypothetical protein
MINVSDDSDVSNIVIHIWVSYTSKP